MEIKAYGTAGSNEDLTQMNIKRRDLQENDVAIKILYCGVCHSDLHTARNEWNDALYPVVPGHEIIGKVYALGAKVSKYRIGDIVGVGCLVDSCGHCNNCHQHEEQFCEENATFTYNSPDPHLGGHTYGGYSSHIIVQQDFVLKVPKNMDLAGTAPLFCAGITTFSPLKRWGTSPGKTVGIVGIGGLGHIAIKIAKAMEAKVIAFTTSELKAKEAYRLGADQTILSTDRTALRALNGKLDLILDTVSAVHDINTYLRLLKLDGVLALVGLPEKPLSFASSRVAFPRRIIVGSGIGGIKETQEMLDFCSKHDITCDIELIDIQEINQAYDRMVKGNVKYRFVIDMASLGAAN